MSTNSRSQSDSHAALDTAALVQRLETVASENGCFGEGGICVMEEPDIRLWCPYCLMGEASKRLRAQAWQPIETAPKDGTAVLTRSRDFTKGEWLDPAVLYYVGGAWRTRPDEDALAIVYFPPKVWMPLPPVPQETP